MTKEKLVNKYLELEELIKNMEMDLLFDAKKYDKKTFYSILNKLLSIHTACICHSFSNFSSGISVDEFCEICSKQIKRGIELFDAIKEKEKNIFKYRE